MRAQQLYIYRRAAWYSSRLGRRLQRLELTSSAQVEMTDRELSRALVSERDEGSVDTQSGCAHTKKEPSSERTKTLFS